MMCWPSLPPTHHLISSREIGMNLLLNCDWELAFFHIIEVNNSCSFRNRVLSSISSKILASREEYTSTTATATCHTAGINELRSQKKPDLLRQTFKTFPVQYRGKSGSFVVYPLTITNLLMSYSYLFYGSISYSSRGMSQSSSSPPSSVHPTVVLICIGRGRLANSISTLFSMLQ